MKVPKGYKRVTNKLLRDGDPCQFCDLPADPNITKAGDSYCEHCYRNEETILIKESNKHFDKILKNFKAVDKIFKSVANSRNSEHNKRKIFSDLYEKYAGKSLDDIRGFLEILQKKVPQSLINIEFHNGISIHFISHNKPFKIHVEAFGSDHPLDASYFYKTLRKGVDIKKIKKADGKLYLFTTYCGTLLRLDPMSTEEAIEYISKFVVEFLKENS